MCVWISGPRKRSEKKTHTRTSNWNKKEKSLNQIEINWHRNQFLYDVDWPFLCKSRWRRRHCYRHHALIANKQHTTHKLTHINFQCMFMLNLICRFYVLESDQKKKNHWTNTRQKKRESKKKIHKKISRKEKRHISRNWVWGSNTHTHTHRQTLEKKKIQQPAFILIVRRAHIKWRRSTNS